MRVSIITSCYNREKTVGETIESVLAQDYPDIEYIVVDGDSNDGSRNVIDRYKNGISKIISEPDGGMYEAINKGLRVATGDVVGLVHSDDFLYSKQTISHVVSAFERTCADLVYGNGLFVSFDDTNKIVRNWNSGPYARWKVKFGWLPLHPTVYVKRTVVEKLGAYDESYQIAADSDFLVRYLYNAELRIHYLDKYVVRMRMGGLSTNIAKTMRMWDEDIRLFRKHGFRPVPMKLMKMAWKVPQFVGARLRSFQV
jgi:glycosyltransferase involved in cell wall biosynthesis